MKVERIEDVILASPPAEQKGYFDAQDGITACPYGVPSNAQLWAKGYDRAWELGLAPLPRFAKCANRRAR